MTEITSLMTAGSEMPLTSPTEVFVWRCCCLVTLVPVVVPELVEDDVVVEEAPSGRPNSPVAAMLAIPSLRSLWYSFLRAMTTCGNCL